MDDKALADLLAALEATPDNAVLRMVVIRAHVERGEHDEAAALVDDLTPGAFTSADDRALIGRALVHTGAFERALAFADGPTPVARMVRARAHRELGQTEEAQREYRAAIADNPTLEDIEFETLLRATDATTGDDVPRLRVLANDDTDDTEVQRLLRPDPKKVTFADVGGLADVKKQIERKIIAPFQKPALFERFKKRVGGGILMYGPPGCGKTLLARATAGECGAAFYNVGISDILDMWIGESERKLHAIFEKAREDPPAVMFFDELEALAGRRQYTREGTASKLVSLFLSEMDGFAQANQGVLILGATNVPWALDPAFRRPGRFDRVLFVPPPDRGARAAILRLQLADRPRETNIDFDALAKRTAGFSGADLENLVETAADIAIEQSLEAGTEVPVGREHLGEALGQTKATTVEWLSTARNHARYANEGGHYDAVLEFLDKHAKR